jgi:glutaminase
MGIERDYLMRQLMMLFDVIQKIFNFRKKGQNEEAEEQIRYFYNFLKIETKIQEKSIEALVKFLVSEKKFTNNHIEMIAFVLKEQGELEEEAEKKLDFFRKAYFLLEKVDRESTSFSMDRQMKLAELRDYLN